MKKVISKLMFGLSTMVVATLGVTATATYAWFMTTRSAVVNITKNSINSQNGSLHIQYVKVANGLDVPSTTDVTNTLDIAAATNEITDISGDGMYFYKPDWNAYATADNLYADKIREVRNGYVEKAADKTFAETEKDATKTYYVTFKLKLYNTGARAFTVFMNGANTTGAEGEKHDGCSVKGHVAAADPDNPTPAEEKQQAKNDLAAKATRVAIWNPEKVNLASGDKPILTWQQTAESNLTKYPYQHLAYTGVATDKAYHVANYNLLADKAANSNLHVGDYKEILSASSAEAGQEVAEVAANSNVTIQVSVWCEGTTSYCRDNYDALTNTDGDTAKGGVVDVSLQFAALYND